MSVDKFLATQHDRMIARVEREVLDWSVDHMTAYTILNRMAVALALVGRKGPDVETAFYERLHQDLLNRLAQSGVGAEVYARRGDILGNGVQDSRDFLRVISRNGITTNAVRRGDPELGAVVRAQTKPSALTSNKER